MRKARLRILLALLAPGALAFAEKTMDYSDVYGVFTVKLPAEWVVEVQEGKKRKADLKLKITPPGAEKAAYFYVWNKKGTRSPRAQAWFDGGRIHRDQQGQSWSIESEPLPHVIIRKLSKTSGAPRVYVVTWRLVRGNGIKIALSCRTALWDKIKETYFEAVQGMTAVVDEFPPRPLGYKEDKRDGYLYLYHRDIKPKVIKDLHRLVKDEERNFSKVHGKIGKSPDYHASIIVHAKKEDALELSTKAAESYAGYYADRATRRVFAVPLGAGKEPRAYFASALRSLFFTLRYGGNQPYWVHEGEVRAAWVTQLSGRKLPALSTGYKKSIPEKLVALDQIAMLKGADLINQAFCYVAFFEAGPPKYQRAFRSFLKEYAATGDWITAQKNHLLRFDRAKFAKDLAKFAKEELKE
jgi:hypothetical protein